MRLGLPDLDAVAAGEPVEVQPRSQAVTEDTTTPEPYQGVTCKPATFKNKVRFRWREERLGATTWHYATCLVCTGPMWQAMSSLRTELLVSTASHKDKHYMRATSNTPTPLREGAVD